MKNMLIAATTIGAAIAGLILLSKKKAVKNSNKKELSKAANDDLIQLEQKRNPIYTMG